MNDPQKTSRKFFGMGWRKLDGTEIIEFGLNARFEWQVLEITIGPFGLNLQARPILRGAVPDVDAGL